MVLAAHPALPTTPAPAVRTVSVTDLTVTPNALVVAPAAEVMWHNDGRNRHTVTADDGAFASPPLFSGDDFSISAPSTPGVYAYHCTFHSYIRGTLTVSLVALTAPDPVDAGRPVVLRGVVPDAGLGAQVRVERRDPGAWVTVGETATDAAGAFSVTAPPPAVRTAYRALAAGTVSPSVRAEVRRVVTARRAGRRLVVGVRPDPAGWARAARAPRSRHLPMGSGGLAAAVGRTRAVHTRGPGRLPW